MSLEGKIGSPRESHLITPAGSASSSSGIGSSALHPASSSSAESSLETLDEPVSVTILRDLRRVAIKLKHVLIPGNTVKELRDCQIT